MYSEIHILDFDEEFLIQQYVFLQLCFLNFFLTKSNISRTKNVEISQKTMVPLSITHFQKYQNNYLIDFLYKVCRQSNAILIFEKLSILDPCQFIW